MTWSMAEDWVRRGLAVLERRDAERIIVVTALGVRFTVYAPTW